MASMNSSQIEDIGESWFAPVTAAPNKQQLKWKKRNKSSVKPNGRAALEAGAQHQAIGIACGLLSFHSPCARMKMVIPLDGAVTEGSSCWRS
jgi:hypothetical protein